jgi:hypothetical protein
MELFESFSPFLKKQIEESPEWKARLPVSATPDRSGFDNMTDDVPF